MNENSYVVELYFPYTEQVAVIKALYDNTTGYIEQTFHVMRLIGDRFENERKSLVNEVAFHCGFTLSNPDRYQVLSFPCMDLPEVLNIIGSMSNLSCLSDTECYVFVFHFGQDTPFYVKSL